MGQGDDILREIVGYNIKRANSAVLAKLVHVLEPFGLRRVTFSALTIIDEQSGLRQADLADALAIDRPNMVLIVGELEDAGLITRTRTTEDRRAYALRPTPSGTRLAKEAIAAVLSFDRAMTRGMTEEERKLTIRLLRKIESNVKAVEVSDV